MRRAYDDQPSRRNTDDGRKRQDGKSERLRRYGDDRADPQDGRGSRQYSGSRWDEHAESSGSRLRTAEQRRDREDGRDERRRRRSHSPPDRRYGGSVREEEEAFKKKEEDEEDKQKAEPNFAASGLLAKESNSKNGVSLKYFEPPEGRKPKKKWRLYIFKDGKEIDVLLIAQQSCYLLGRDHTVADIPVDHASISKQHAVIQYRSITSRNEYGDEKQSIKPFLIDLDSANGSFVNEKEIPSSRYYELRNGDTITFGGSEREFVLLRED